MPKRQRISEKKPADRRNPAAVALGRLGGLKRAQTVLQTIPAAKRSMYARHASLARWAQVRAKKEHPPE
jgi:hypothetical protein